MRVYEHREINAEHDYEVWYVSADCTKPVNKDKADYLGWIAEGNTPEIIPYVEPAQLDIEVLRRRAIFISETRRALKLAGGFEFNGNVFDTTATSRELISYVVQIANMQPETYTREMVLKNGTSTTLSRAEILALFSSMLVYGEGLYSSWLAEYKMLLTANREQIDAYIGQGNLPE